MIALVGYTGFVGSNIYAAGKDAIDCVYNSENVQEAYGTAPDLLIYAGMRAEKYLANTAPQADMELVFRAEENIAKIAPKKLVLISTIDVFHNPNGKDEDAPVTTEGLHAYGLNRYRLEQWVRERYPDALIVRLPALYGLHMKKNFIYDFLHVIPSMLKGDTFEELAAQAALLREYYQPQENGFYKCQALAPQEEQLLKETFQGLGFTALNFTDSRNAYQFYPLSRLWEDLQTALEASIPLWHPATEPVSAGEVYRYLTGEEFVNHIAPQPIYYNYKTKYADVFGGRDGYLMGKDAVLSDIKKFVEGARA